MKNKQNKAIQRGNFSFELTEKLKTTSINNFNLARAMPFLIILLLSISTASAADVVVKAGDFDIGKNLNVTGNMTLGQKITFALGEIIDNIVDGIIKITGSLEVTNDLNVSGLIYGNGSQLTDLPESGNSSWNESYASNKYVNKSGDNMSGDLRVPNLILPEDGKIKLDATHYIVLDGNGGLFEVEGLDIKNNKRGQIFLYKTSAQDLANAGTWYDVTWADAAATVKNGMTHDHAGANPEQITITNSGTYLISYMLRSYTAAYSYGFSGRVLDDGVEIPGSWAEMFRSYNSPLTHTFLAYIEAGSVIKLQAGTWLAGLDIIAGDLAGAPDPTTRPSATISMIKINPDTT